MICVELKKYNKPCNPTVAGVSNMWTFDPNDVDWAYTAGTGYTAVTLVDSTVAPMPFVLSQIERDSASFKYTQSKSGSSISYAYEIEYQLAETSQSLTEYLTSLDTASICCGIGYVFYMNSGKIFVIGEKIVGGVPQPEFYLSHNGTEGDSGKATTDFTGATVKVTGTYSRGPREFTGSITAITALQLP